MQKGLFIRSFFNLHQLAADTRAGCLHRTTETQAFTDIRTDKMHRNAGLHATLLFARIRIDINTYEVIMQRFI
jgi:hypothetical protein